MSALPMTHSSRSEPKLPWDLLKRTQGIDHRLVSELLAEGNYLLIRMRSSTGDNDCRRFTQTPTAGQFVWRSKTAPCPRPAIHPPAATMQLPASHARTPL